MHRPAFPTCYDDPRSKPLDFGSVPTWPVGVPHIIQHTNQSIKRVDALGQKLTIVPVWLSSSPADGVDGVLVIADEGVGRLALVIVAALVDSPVPYHTVT